MNFLLIALFLLLALCFSRVKLRQNKAISMLLVFFISLIIANRDVKVPDTEEYIQWFLTDYDFFNFDSSPYEKGYTLFMRTFHLFLGGNYTIYFAVFPLMNFYLLSKANERICGTLTFSKQGVNYRNVISVNYLLLLITYFGYYGLYHNAIVLRAGVATVLLMLSLAFLLQKWNRRNLLGVIIFFMLALSFHTSVLLCIPMFLFARRDLLLSKGQYRIILIGILFFYILSPYLEIIMTPLNQLFLFMGNSDYDELSKFDYYSGQSTYSNVGFSFKFLFFYFWGWLFVLSEDINYVWKRLLNMYIFGLLIWAMFRPVLWVERITDFYIFLYVFLAMIFACQNQKERTSVLLISTSCLMQLLFVYRIVYF